jgi:Polyketide cyclase / dehydrase and lipid transport
MPEDNVRSADDFRTAIPMFEERLELAAGVEEVWGELSAGDYRFLPGVRVDWLTEQPYGIGTLRVMNFGPIHLRSRYYAWDETNHSKAFYLENPPPGFRDMTEEYRVTPNGAGSTIWFRLSIVPAPIIRPFQRPLSRLMTFSMRRWHIRFFKRRFQAANGA